MTDDVTKSPLRRLLTYSSAHRRQIVLASLYSILNTLFDLAPPLLIGMAVNVVVAQEDSFLGELGVTEPLVQLTVLAILTIIIWGFESLFQYLYSIKWRNLAQTVQHELRVDSYSHVQELDMAYFEDRSTGGLLAILNDDINQLERFLDVGANELWHIFTSVVAIGTFFFIVAPQVAWLALIPMPFVLYGSLRFQRRFTPLYAAVREKVGELNGQLANNIGGIATIKSFTAEKFEQRRISELSGAYRSSNQDAIRVSSAFIPLIRMVIVVGFFAIMVLGGLQVLQGNLNVGLFTTMVFLTQRLLWPLTRLGDTLDLYQRAMASTARVLDLLDTERYILSGSETLPTAEVAGKVVFDHVGFAYGADTDDQDLGNNGRSSPNNQPIIKNLSINVPAGHTVAIVGATGSGKSTLVKLLLRFYDVQQGRVCLDGHDIRNLQIHDLRQAIGFVSQDVFLFHGSVRENIAYGTFDADMETIITAAKTAEAHDFIMNLPDGYETIVGERGQKLSGGQRQRISIARAVLKNPPVLVLDEATSAVDNETEAAIQRSMERIIVGRTTIVIAHRLSTIRNADQIYVLERGVLQENGRHEELVAQDGIYANLWAVQTGRLISHG